MFVNVRDDIRKTAKRGSKNTGDTGNVANNEKTVIIDQQERKIGDMFDEFQAGFISAYHNRRAQFTFCVPIGDDTAHRDMADDQDQWRDNKPGEQNLFRKLILKFSGIPKKYQDGHDNEPAKHGIAHVCK